MKPAMFSITPAISSLSFPAMSAEALGDLLCHRLRRVTIRNFASGNSWESVIETSPVPGAQIDQQVVDARPFDVSMNCCSALCQHRTAPYDRGVLLDEEADRDDLDAVGTVQRHDLALGVDLCALAAQPNMRGCE